MYSFHDFAVKYRDLGLHPIPLKQKSKDPVIAWKKYQTEPPTDKELEAWFSNPVAQFNLGIVLGRGVFAVDLDGGKEAEKLLMEMGITLPENAPRSKTGAGYHVFLRSSSPIPDKVGLLSTNGQKPQVDIRGVGYVVAPPSIHPSGEQYRWVIDLDNEIPLAPDSLLDLIFNRKDKKEKPKDWVTDALKGVDLSRRDDTCTRLAGYFIGKNIPPAVVLELLNETFARKCNPPLMYSEVQKCVQSIANKHGAIEESVTYEPEFIEEVVERLLASINKPVKLIPTSFSAVDELLYGGFAPAELIYLAAHAGVGKTSLALQIMVGCAKNGIPVLYVSREMLSTQLIQRMISQVGGIDPAPLRRGNVPPEIEKEVRKVAQEISTLSILMDDRTTTVEGIINTLSTPRVKDIGLLIVDYLQLVGSETKEKDRRLQVEYVSRHLKNIAMQFKIPVLCMCAMSRSQNKDKENPRPTIQSLRESGALEHDADMVILLHRERGKEETEFILAKNRNGRVGTIDIRFKPEYQIFTSLETQDELIKENPIAKDGYVKEPDTQELWNH